MKIERKFVRQSISRKRIHIVETFGNLHLYGKVPWFWRGLCGQKMNLPREPSRDGVLCYWCMQKMKESLFLPLYHFNLFGQITSGYSK